MNAVLLGATKGMGRALARLMADRGERMFLLGRHEDDLQRSAADLQARGADGEVGWFACDLEDPDTFSAALDKATETLGTLHTVVVTAGMFATQETLEQDTTLTGRLLEVNFTNTVLFCEQVRERMLAVGGGTLCVFSSVAGDRGRKPVALYGAAKAGLSHYLESLDHKHRAVGLKEVCVKPGFVKTSMTADLEPPPFAGEAEPVARRVLKAIDRGDPVVYAPGVWGPIMWVIRSLPRQIMRKVSF